MPDFELLHELLFIESKDIYKISKGAHRMEEIDYGIDLYKYNKSIGEFA